MKLFIATLFFMVLSAVYSFGNSPYQKYPSILNAPFSYFDAYANKKETINEIMRKSAEYQLDRYGDKIPTKDWLVGTFFSSFVAAYGVTRDNWYLDQAYDWGVKSEWDIELPMNADDVCPGQTYLDLYFIKKDPELYQTLHSKLSVYFDRKEILPFEKKSHQRDTLPLDGRNAWSWCDALYMAPPVYARMGKATGDARYYEMLHRLYWDAVDFLYAPDEKLFHRDSKERTEKDTTPNGKKVYWGRGNGWVIGGLARMIEFLPDTDTMKVKYIELFRDLSYSLARYQMEDGLWRSSVNDPEWYPMKETSGSSFYVYAMAKGINEGWLPKDYFMPVVSKGWSGLVSCVTPQGKLGYCQIVAGQPNEVRPQDSKDYAVGAFILAGTEMLKLNSSKYLEETMSRKFEPRLVQTDGAWTWYNDERVIFSNNVFWASYVKRDGTTAATAFSIEKWSSWYAQKEKILSTWSQEDDHNNGAFLPLKDGKILVTYAQHGKGQMNFYQRKISTPKGNLFQLSEEEAIKAVDTKKGLTYQNLYRLSDEKGRIYNFFRGNNLNPNFVTSDDEAETWSEPIWMISAGSNSTKRPYVKYVSNGKDRIDFLYTDGHPRNEKQNNVYHFYYSKGIFYSSKGKQLRTMEEIKTRPIDPEEGTLVFDGSTANGRGWVYDLEYDENGQPHAAFISSPSGDMGSDMRYWTATFDGKKWKTDEIAFAGSNLYAKEQHYAGGFALHPGNSKQVVISANVNPKDGKKLPNNKYQLFKGVREGRSWKWEQLTFDPVFDHLRPVIIRGEKNALFWFTGDYLSFHDYNTDIMMSYEF